MLSVNDDKPILITEDMVGKDKKITIPLDVTFNKCAFLIVSEGNKKRLKAPNEKINILASLFDCDKLFNDNKEIKDDESFLFLAQGRDYTIELYDEYYISNPELKNPEKTTVLLQRFKTFGGSLSSLKRFESVPYKIFYYDDKLLQITKLKKKFQPQKKNH